MCQWIAVVFDSIFVNEPIVVSWFLKNINSVVILKCPKRMLEYYFSKVFTILECNVNNLAKLPNELKQRIHAEEKDDSDKFMICINTITSTSNTLNNLVLNNFFCFIKTNGTFIHMKKGLKMISPQK